VLIQNLLRLKSSSCSSLHLVVAPNAKPTYVPPHVVDLGLEYSFPLLILKILYGLESLLASRVRFCNVPQA